MSTVLEVFGKNGYAQHRLPPLRNADYSIWLSPREFGSREPLRIYLENVDDQWYILGSELYFPEDAWEGSRKLLSGDSFTLITAYGDRYTLVVSEAVSGIRPFGKYRMKESVTIGRKRENDILLLNRRGVSRTHACIEKTADGWIISSKSINGIYINGEFINSSKPLRFGDHINIMGLVMVFLTDYIAVEDTDPGVAVRLEKAGGQDLSPRPLGDGDDPKYRDITLFHRSPRSLKQLDTSEVVIDAPPEKEDDQGQSTLMAILSILIMAVPMAGGSMFMIYAMEKEGMGKQLLMYGGLVMSGLMVITGLVWVIIQEIYNRRLSGVRWKSYSASYRRYLTVKEEDIRRRHEETRNFLEERYIHAGAAMEMISATESLWIRAPFHSDFLVCRLGLGNRCLPVEISVPKDHFHLIDNPLMGEMYALKERFVQMDSVPLVISLADNKMIGLAARREEDRIALARNIIIQFALSNCYTETKIGLVYDAQSSCYGENWDFVRWLPHVWSQNREFRLLASCRKEAGDLFYRLMSIIRKREASEDGQLPVYILFIEAPHYLEGEPIEAYLTDQNRCYGIFVVWLAPEKELLPHSCDFVVEKNEDFQGYYSLLQGVRTDLSFDEVSEDAADEFARDLSLFRVHEKEGNNEIPTRVTFLEMLGIETVEEIDLRGFWKKNRTLDSLRAPIGLKAGGRKKYLDIHEKYHGPHGLVAGTTGSGKSELLQSYILSLLILYSPEAVNLFLIDYKGGGMAGMFDGLPHLCGQISNLSGSSIHRAMIALKSENQRRQRLFAKYQVNSITDYMKLCYEQSDMEPMPHLLIVIDEFAELKKEEPDFMQGLISVAQVGRSLGLHLILATQKPGGVVDDKIWSNARFRLCLRVQEKQDSMDMLHKPDAADLMQVGRCCFQVGNDEIYEIFQSGWTGAPYLGKDSSGRGKSACRILLSGEEDRVHLRNSGKNDNGQTQFQAVKKTIMEMAKREGYEKARQLWREPLPDSLFLDDVMMEYGKAQGLTCPEDSVYVGLADDPANQSRLPVFLRYYVHTIVCGLPASGKSTFLQTALYGMVKSQDPSRVHLYILDYSNGACKAFEDMPHVGAVITEGQEMRTQLLFLMLIKKLEERKTLFAGGNYLQYNKSEPDTLMPRIILVIDNISSFQEKTDHRYFEDLRTLCREGANAGINLLITCGGVSSTDLPVQLFNFFTDVFCLELKDGYAYGEMLGSTRIPLVPDKGICGRGLSRIEERILEFQTGLAVPSTDDYERMRQISAEAGVKKAAYAGPLPAPVKAIPERPGFRDLLGEDEINSLFEQDAIPVGYNERTAELSTVFLTNFYCFVVTGRKKGGKHNFMRLFIKMLKKKKEAGLGSPVSINIIDYRGIFSHEANDFRIDRYLSDEKAVSDFLDELTQVFRARKDGEAGKEPCYIILIENLARLLDEEAGEDLGIGPYLANAWDKGADLGVVFMGIIEEEDIMTLSARQACQAFLRYATGIHLGGNLVEDTVFDHGDFSYEEKMEILKPGRGYLFFNRDQMTRVLIPKMEVDDDPY